MERSGVGAGELCGLIHMRMYVCLCAGNCLRLDMIVDNHTPHTFCVCNCAVLARAFTLVCECQRVFVQFSSQIALILMEFDWNFADLWKMTNGCVFCVLIEI